MSPEEQRAALRARMARVEALYHQMLERPAQERVAALAAACPHDPALAAEVQSLLDQPESTAGLFASPALDLAARAVSAAGQSLVGRRLGAFEIQGLLGKGGMGEVYRGWDKRLSRAVAIKILPSAFQDDPDRGARFEREAHLLASLNHPNIGAVYGLEEVDGVKALIMELVEGEDLSERLARGPVPVEEALPIARQIAEAVEAAHERGVIHRDLKPANIKLRPDGTVKVLDFGLAKALEPTGAANADPTESPTLTARATRIGMILGTAAYMAPEQALGRPVDRRADIWSFGVVLYEMLTGRRAFSGADIPSTLAAVLSGPPSLSALPDSASPRIRRLLERCLDRDPRTRLRDIGEARIALARAEAGASDGAVSAPFPVPMSTLAPSRGAMALFGTMVVVALLLAASWVQRSRLRLPETRLVMPLDEGLQYPGIAAFLSVAPDGRTIVFSATKGPGVGQQSLGGGGLFVRRLDQVAATPLNQVGQSPFFSPDGEWIAFFHDGKLKKIPVAGGTPTEIAPVDASGSGDWGQGGVIVFGDAADLPSEGIRMVPASGGAVSVVTRLDGRSGQTHHLAPQVLPRGQVLFTIRSEGGGFQLAIAPISGGPVRVILGDAMFGRYLGGGVLVFQRGGDLLAARFDEKTLVVGEGVPVLSGIYLYWRNPAWAMASGTLVYRPERDDGRTLLWVDRHGVAKPVGAPPRSYWNPRLSPEGDRIATFLGQGGTTDIWTYDIPSGRLQKELNDGRSPAWTPDGTHLLIDRMAVTSEVLSLRLDGSGFTEPITHSGRARAAAFMTKDGRSLVFYEIGRTTGYDLMITEPGSNAPARPLVRTPQLEAGARLHPGGRFVAYASNVTGRDDVFVTSFPDTGPRIPVTTDGGREPIWSHDGREIFYRKGSQVFSAAFRPGPSAAFDPPRLLFDVPYFQSGGPGNSQYDVAPDGRFLMIKVPERETPYIGVILNWAEALRKAIGEP
ncbi:MAG: serine/threonine-protein kinase [Vicinamibacteria bacterium]|nr:serine/threonine-protein kinase [Vicinamibacteria bacterium]